MVLNPIKVFNLRFSKHKNLYNGLYMLLGFVPNRVFIYRQALTHHTFYRIKSNKKNDNERLEFLGDAILDAVVGDILFKKFPFKGEGFLTDMRSKVVSRENLASLARKMGVLEFIRYDAKNERNNSFINQISGNALEALFGAMYLDKGYKFTYNFLENRVFKLYIDIHSLENQVLSYKGKLFKWCQQNHKKLLLDCKESLINNKLMFTIKIFIDDEDLGNHEHVSKKKAEELACQKACENLSL